MFYVCSMFCVLHTECGVLLAVRCMLFYLFRYRPQSAVAATSLKDTIIVDGDVCKVLMMIVHPFAVILTYIGTT